MTRLSRLSVTVLLPSVILATLLAASPGRSDAPGAELRGHQPAVKPAVKLVKDRFDPGMGTYKIIELTGMLYPRANLLYVTSTTGGGHAPGSYHYRGCAVDYGAGVGNALELTRNNTNRWVEMDRAATWWYQRSAYLTELEHTKNRPGAYGGGWYVKNGKRVSRFFFGRANNLAHKNHIHVAVATVVMANKMFVSVYQWVLKDLGYYHGLQDGSNGPKTKAAVKAFQIRYGIVADGVVGPRTVAMMRKAEGWGAL